MKKILVTAGLLIIGINRMVGQCAMCRTTVENNITTGDSGLAAALNTGILYLFAMPYLIVGIVAYLWYRNSRKNTTRKTAPVTTTHQSEQAHSR